MAINTTTRQTTAFTSGNNFAFAFKVYEVGDVKVIQVQTSNGAETVLTITTNYTVTLNDDQDGNPGGTVTLVSSGSAQNLASGYNIVITSKVSALQQTEITNQGGFFPEVINDVFDKAVILDQQQQSVIDKSIRFPITQTVGGLEITENAATRANKTLVFDGSGDLSVSATVDGRDVSADGTKLDTIETNAKDDQTAAEIKTLVESASDSNVFTDADHSKLNGIQAGATADQSASDIRTLVESANDSNVFTDADHTKLNNMDASATDDQTASEIKSLIAGSPLDASHLAANSVDSSELVDGSVDHSHLSNDCVDGDNIADNSIGAEHLQANSVDSSELVDGSVDTSHLSADCVDATKIADNAIGSEHLQANSVTTSEIADAELSTLAGMQSGTASKLADSTALTSDIADLNQIDGMTKQTTITNSDSHFPTSGAVVDFVADQIAPVGGLEVIADEDSFPATQPVSGVVISIANIDGLIVNSSGVATNARTVGSGSDNVTINNFPASLRSKTMAAELGLLVSSTGASQTYNYHKLLAKEADVEQLSNDINDFGNRYRVVSSNPTSDNDAGDLIFNTSTQKLLVYNSTNSAFEEAQSIGNFFISTFSESFDGSRTDFTVSNAPTNAQQIILSINGVVQKPNNGTSTPSEGFALTGSTVKLSSAPASGSDVFIIVMGSTVNIGTPSNNTVTSAILQNGSVIEAKLGVGAVTNTKLSLISTSSVAGLIVKGDGSTDGYLQLNCSANSHGIKLKSPPHSAGQSYTLTFPSNIVNGQFLTTDANGNLSWAAVTTDLVNDTSPQLGGALAMNNQNITGNDSTGGGNNRVVLGSGSDLQLYHATHTYIDNETNTDFNIRNLGNGPIKLFVQNSYPVELYFNASKKFETISTGVHITGTTQSAGHINPDANNTYDLGTTSLRWRNIYTNDLNLSNEGGSNDVDGTWGSYTIQEGAEDLFLVNKRNGKKYKFALTEVS